MLFSAAELDLINVTHKTAVFYQPAHHKGLLVINSFQSDVWFWQITAWRMTEQKDVKLHIQGPRMLVLFRQWTEPTFRNFFTCDWAHIKTTYWENFKMIRKNINELNLPSSKQHSVFENIRYNPKRLKKDFLAFIILSCEPFFTEHANWKPNKSAASVSMSRSASVV